MKAQNTTTTNTAALTPEDAHEISGLLRETAESLQRIEALLHRISETAGKVHNSARL